MSKNFARQSRRHADRSPYFHWWKTIGDTGQVSSDFHLERLENTQSIGLAPAFAKYFGDGSDLPIPMAVRNPNMTSSIDPVPMDLANRIREIPPPDSVITIVIDEAIALGHPRFRFSDGSSRILASWQQGASFDKAQENYLPFGNVLFQEDINRLLQAHSDRNDIAQSLDETAFNRASLLSEPLQSHDSNAITRTVGHGTAVLDLVAGADASKTQDDVLKKRPIIAVNLPRRATIGMAGTFLEYFTIHALVRTVAMVDALWDSHYPNKKQGGYPIVVNISYGQQAGPKDGNSLLEQLVEAIQLERAGKKPPLEVVMPAGNDNLMRCNARREMYSGSSYFAQDWRIQPEDHSSNFVEIWNEQSDADIEINPLAISLRPPGEAEMTPWQGKHGQFMDVDGGARIYCQKILRSVMQAADDGADYVSEKTCRFRYVICVPPTAEASPGAGVRRLAPAGIWKINIPRIDVSSNVYMNVQVDQSAEPDGQRNRRSYFIQGGYRTHEGYRISDGYRTHEENGRPMDAFTYPYKSFDESNLDKWLSNNHIQRKGTVNSIAMNKGIVVVASHRRSDGRPCDFSATAFPPNRKPSPDSVMTVSAASDEGAMHLGILAAGTQAGSVVALRGTSFSAPTVARRIVELLLEKGPHHDAVGTLKNEALKLERDLKSPWAEAAPPKIGSGRLDSGAVGDRISRI